MLACPYRHSPWGCEAKALFLGRRASCEEIHYHSARTTAGIREVGCALLGLVLHVERNNKRMRMESKPKPYTEMRGWFMSSY